MIATLLNKLLIELLFVSVLWKVALCSAMQLFPLVDGADATFSLKE